MKTAPRHSRSNCALQSRGRWLSLIVPVILMAVPARADEPYARGRDYDLQHSKIALQFDVEQKNVIGDVTHTVTVLKDDTSKLAFDSVGLTIQSVSVNKAAAESLGRSRRRQLQRFAASAAWRDVCAAVPEL